MNNKARSVCQYLIPVILTAVGSYGYSITHFAIGVDDTASKLYFEEGLSVCTNRWTLFFLNKVLHLNFIHWPTWLVELFAVCILTLSFSLWCLLIHRVLLSVGISLPQWVYGFAASLALSCPIMSEIWVYYLQNGISIAYGFTALSLLLFLQSLQHNDHRVFPKILCGGLCLAVALGCYETMLDCFLIGVLIIFMLLHGLTTKKENRSYDIRILPWVIRGCIILIISLLIRTVVPQIFTSIYHLDNMEKYGVNSYNSFLGDLLVTPGSLAILLKKMYLKYAVNAVVYLPIMFLVIAGIILISWAVYYTIKRRDLWIIICIPVITLVPVLSSIAAGRVKSYHSAQFVPVVLLISFIILSIILFYSKGLTKKIITAVIATAALSGIIMQICNINKWFLQDYNKYLEAKQIMTDVAEDLIDSYDIAKPLVVVGATRHSDSLCQEACIPMDSWQYRIVTKLTYFDPSLKEKFHANYGGWAYYYADSPLLSVLTWSGSPFENGDLAASQQYTRFWEMIGYPGFYYVSTTNMILEAAQIKSDQNMPGYPSNGYIYDNGDMIIINLSDVS